MRTKAQKKEIISKISEKIPEAGMIVFTAYSREGKGGLSVSQMRELKKTLKATGGDYVVAKKNLIRIAVNRSNFAEKIHFEEFNGSLGLVFSAKDADSAALAKTVHNFAKNHPVFKIYGAVLKSLYFDADSFSELARLPSREVMIGRVISLIKYPPTGLVSVLRGSISNLLLLVKNIKKY